MKPPAFTSGLLALTGAAMAAPAADVDAATSKSFSLIATHSGSPIHLHPINANAEGLWINKPTTSYCPEPASQCPPGNVTAFSAGGGALYMAVEVAGGQQAYIDPKTRALKYSIAHSEPPTGAILTGFKYTPGKQFGTLTHPGGFVACKSGTAYQIFVPSAKVPKTGCIGLDALGTYTGTTVSAWQYT